MTGQSKDSNPQPPKGTGSLLQDLLGSVILVKKCKIPTELQNHGQTRVSELKEKSSRLCSICSDPSGKKQLYPFTLEELDILEEMVLSTSVALTTFMNSDEFGWRCYICSLTLKKLGQLKKRIWDITMCLRAVIRIQHKPRFCITEDYNGKDEDGSWHDEIVLPIPSHGAKAGLVTKVEEIDIMEDSACTSLGGCEITHGKTEVMDELEDTDIKPGVAVTNNNELEVTMKDEVLNIGNRVNNVDNKNNEEGLTEGTSKPLNLKPTCDECGRSFSRREHLVRHQNNKGVHERLRQILLQKMRRSSFAPQEGFRDLKSVALHNHSEEDKLQKSRRFSSANSINKNSPSMQPKVGRLGDLTHENICTPELPDVRQKRKSRTKAEELLHSMEESDVNDVDSESDFVCDSDNVSESDNSEVQLETINELCKTSNLMVEDHQSHRTLYPCNQCGKMFGSRSHLHRHQKTVHNPEKVNSNKQPRLSLQPKKSSVADPLACSTCGKKFENLLALSRHKPEHFVKCDICVQEFSSEVGLQQHLKSKSHNEGVTSRKIKDDGSITYLCDKCGTDFNLLPELRRHKNVHHKEKTRCDPCNKDLKSVSGYKEHLLTNSHMNIVGSEGDLELEEKRKFACEICNKRFFSKGMLRKHKSVHVRPYVCEMCGRQFSQRSGLNMHYKTHEDKLKTATVRKKADRLRAPKDKPFGCKKCDKRFLDKSGMYRHLKAFHNGYRFKCGSCPKDFASLAGLKHHEKNNHASNKETLRTMKTVLATFPCDICPRSLTGKCNLSRHIELVHFPEKSTCPYGCPDKFETEDEWRVHLEQCTSNKMSEKSRCYCFFCGDVFPNQLLRIAHQLRLHANFPCEICSRVFTRKDILHQHQFSHEESRPHLCSKCGKRFKQQWNLRIHTTTVCGDDETARVELVAKRRELHRIYREKQKPFKCDQCSKRFVEERRLTHHKRRVHKANNNSDAEDDNDMEYE